MLPRNAMKTSLIAALLMSTALTANAQDMKTIGQITAVIAEASVADDAAELQNGMSGDTAFLDLSRFSAASVTHLCGFSFESQGAFPS